MSRYRQAPQREPEKKTNCSQPVEVVIDGRLNSNGGKSTLSAKLWRTQTSFMVEKKTVSQQATAQLLHTAAVYRCSFSTHGE